MSSSSSSSSNNNNNSDSSSSPLVEPLINSGEASALASWNEAEPLSNGAILLVLSLADYDREQLLFAKYQDEQRRRLAEEALEQQQHRSELQHQLHQHHPALALICRHIFFCHDT